MQEAQEMRIWFLGQEDPLEEDMATHSSIVAWRIPWTEEPGGCSPLSCEESGMTEVAWASKIVKVFLSLLPPSLFRRSDIV